MPDTLDSHLLIAGEAISGGGRDIHDVINPATGERIAGVTHATTADLDKALEAAARGFKAWRATSADERSAVLLKAAGLIRERALNCANALDFQVIR